MNPQQQQPVMPPTNDFLSRMDISSGIAPTPEPEKKGLSKGAIIGIVVGVVAVIGIIAAVIIMNITKKPEPTPTTTGYVEPEPEVDEEMVERNKLRAKDLLPVREAINTYQALPQVNGLLPGPTVDDWTWVINTYGPEGGLKDSVDGELYTVGAVCKFGEDCVDIQSLSWEENKHQVFALYNAECKGKTKDNVIVSSTRKRRVAIFAIIEGDEFICTTNGN